MNQLHVSDPLLLTLDAQEIPFPFFSNRHPVTRPMNPVLLSQTNVPQTLTHHLFNVHLNIDLRPTTGLMTYSATVHAL
jgi:hypothetical protein